MRLRSTIMLAANLTLNLLNSQSLWSTESGVITYNKTSPYIIRGTNWHGIESDCSVPHGLWANKMDFYFDLLKSNGFNSIRLPVSYEIMNNLHTPVLDTCLEADPEYMGLEIGEFMDHFIDKAKIFGMTVLIDQHTILGKIPSHPWSENINSDMTINAWISFLKRFSNKVFAIELKNEPHDDCSLETYFTWCGEAIHRIENETNYRGLYFISGVQLSKSDNNKNHAWGGTFNDLESSPDLINKLGIPINRLVFCPHVYGTSVRSDSVVNDGPPNWDADFGFIKTKDWELKNIPVIFSEMGGFLTGTDIDFYNRFKDYAHDKGLTAGLYWWSLPSTSVDTGGLIENDFKTIDWNKMNYVKNFISNPTYNISP